VHMLKPALNVVAQLENKSLKYNTVHKLWGSLSLSAQNPISENSVEIDFVVIIDTIDDANDAVMNYFVEDGF